MAKDYYQILGVPRTASSEEIKKAYRKLAHQYHPDKKGGDEARFKEVNEAYQVLSDPKKKSNYDNFGFAYNDGGFGAGQGGFDYSDIFGNMNGEDIFSAFSDIFGGFGQGYRKDDNRPGENLYIEVVLKKDDLGKQRAIDFEALGVCDECEGVGAEKGYDIVTCPECKGSGQVRHTSRTPFGVFSRIGICNKCGGKGRYPEKVCHKCKGEGRVKTKRQIDILVPKNIEDDYTIAVPKGGNAPGGGQQNGRSGDLVIHLRLK